MEPFVERLRPTGLGIEKLWHKKPLYFPKDHPLITALQRVYQQETGLKPELLSIGMGTYAKEIPNIVAFGPILPGRLDLDHKANENISIDDLILNTKIYAKAIMELANLES
jgi:succinyl-diaminopimelate desuccinylase